MSKVLATVLAVASMGHVRASDRWEKGQRVEVSDFSRNGVSQAKRRRRERGKHR